MKTVQGIWTSLLGPAWKASIFPDKQCFPEPSAPCLNSGPLENTTQSFGHCVDA